MKHRVASQRAVKSEKPILFGAVRPDHREVGRVADDYGRVHVLEVEAVALETLNREVE
jgi:hypothetical protein